jgi:hypothetical protein
LAKLDAVKRNRPRYALISAIAIWLFALGMFWFSLSLAQQTKPGGATMNEGGHPSFTASRFGQNQQPAKPRPKSTPKPTPTPPPKKKGCDDEEKDQEAACKKAKDMEKEWEDKCVAHYEQNKSACDHGAVGAGLGELETKCKQAKAALAKCQGKDTGSKPTPSPSRCDLLFDSANDACEFAQEFYCECRFGNYDDEWCIVNRAGQTIEDRVASLRKSCHEAQVKLKQQCHSRMDWEIYWRSEGCLSNSYPSHR